MSSASLRSDDLRPLETREATVESMSEMVAERNGNSATIGRGIRLLVVDDEKAQRGIVAEILAAAGYQVEMAAGLDEAVERVSVGGVDIVLTDLRMPGGSGIDVLDRVKGLDGEIEVVLMTAYSDVKTAVEAMRRGAYDYLAKPFEKDELLLAMDKVADRIRLRRENRDLKTRVAERFAFGRMIGGSPLMQEVYRTIEKVRSGSSTVLIRGESGTGKELVARAVHSSGERGDRPFVAINCAAIPEALVESELFGHELGAFTGALASKVGRFEEVEDGTLFLDEIASMRIDLQAKLLRVIQEREFQRIGSSRMLEFRGRIVAATSQNLEELIQGSKFREDLYFRLNVVPIALPALRDRPGDLPLLASRFLENFSRELGKELRSFTPEALDRLESHDWPGNVRELENLIERVVVLSDDDVEVIDASMLAGRPSGRLSETAASEIPAGGGDSADEFALPDRGLVLADLESHLIRQALEKSRGKLEPAASLLGITYKTLQYRIRKYGLQEHQGSSSSLG